MGFWKTLLDVVDVVSDPVSAMYDKEYKVSCTSLEIFEIGTQWKGTARIHGAGEHIKTVNVNYGTTITLPYRDDDAHYTRRGLLRKQFREWAGKIFSDDGKITKENVVLNPSENCLSVEGFAREVGNKWLIVDNASDASHFCSYKIFLTDVQNNTKVGHEKLNDLFMAETLGRITSVDVKEGF